MAPDSDVGKIKGKDRYRTVYMKIVDTSGYDNGEKSTIVAYGAWRALESRAGIVSAEEDENEKAAAEAQTGDLFLSRRRRQGSFRPSKVDYEGEEGVGFWSRLGG